jgi:hypothetical protein
MLVAGPRRRRLTPTASPHRILLGAATAAILVVAAVAGCDAAGQSPPAAPSSGTGDALATRLVAIDDAVDRWRSAADLASARAGAEEARNLVVGPTGPFYGDGDGDGMVEGASEIGLLPGLGGEAGLATPGAGACVVRDVLGGSWANPEERWAILETAIGEWSELNNTFPALPSHPQRIVGWATLTLGSTDLVVAQEFGGHAHLHIDVALQATTGCAQ